MVEGSEIVNLIEIVYRTYENTNFSHQICGHKL